MIWYIDVLLDVILFVSVAQLLCSWIVNHWSRWLASRRAAEPAESPLMELADPSYTFSALLVDEIMRSMQFQNTAEWCKKSPTLLTLRALSHGGRQAVDEDGPVNGHMTAAARGVGAIGRYLHVCRIQQQTRRPLLKVLMARYGCSKAEARAVVFELELPPRAGEFSENDVQRALDFLRVTEC